MGRIKNLNKSSKKSFLHEYESCYNTPRRQDTEHPSFLPHFGQFLSYRFFTLLTGYRVFWDNEKTCRPHYTSHLSRVLLNYPSAALCHESAYRPPPVPLYSHSTTLHFVSQPYLSILSKTPQTTLAIASHA